MDSCLYVLQLFCILNQSYYFFSLLVKAKEKSSDSQWLKSVVSSGTLNDKVAALTVQIQVSQWQCS